MTQKQKPERNFGAAVILGLAAGAVPIYFLSQCPASEPRRSYSQPVSAYQPELRPASEVLDLPYNTRRTVGGVELEFIRREYGAEARVRYPISNGSIDTGMRAEQGKTHSLPVNDSDLKIQITMNSHDEQRLNVSVVVSKR